MNLTETKSIFYIGTKPSYTYLKTKTKTLWLCTTEEVGWAVAFKAYLGLVPSNPLTSPRVTLLVFHLVLASLLRSSNLPCQPIAVSSVCAVFPSDSHMASLTYFMSLLSGTIEEPLKTSFKVSPGLSTGTHTHACSLSHVYSPICSHLRIHSCTSIHTPHVYTYSHLLSHIHAQSHYTHYYTLMFMHPHVLTHTHTLILRCSHAHADI